MSARRGPARVSCSPTVASTCCTSGTCVTSRVRARGDLLVVALNTDESVRALKGPTRPLMPLEERAEVVGALRCVAYVLAFAERDLEATLRALRPDVHAKGTDYTVDTVPERGVDRELGIEIVICGDAKERSSTGFAARLESERA